MKIKIPTEVLNQIPNTETITLVCNKITCSLHESIFKMGVFSLNDSIFNNVSDIHFLLKYKDGQSETFAYEKNALIINNSVKIVAPASRRFVPETLLKRNVNLVNSEINRKVILDSVKQQYESILSQPDELITTGKNLLYYSIFDVTDQYINLLYKSLLSLFDTASTHYDILFITDELTKGKIQAMLNKLKMKGFFHIVPTPSDGIEASKYKTLIYNYERIDNYENILFVDADTLIIKNIQAVFANAKSYNVLYTAFNKNLKITSHQTSLFHGFAEVSDEVFNQMKDHNQMPFNAGQFLFKNSSYMRKHFEIVNWFMVNWPGEYFFEQAFMNYYFCSNILTDCTTFDKNVLLIPAHQNPPPLDTTVILHFIGPALDAVEKLKNISKYKTLGFF